MLAESTTLTLFMAKVEKDPESGCWLWTAALKPQGYGQFTANGRIGLVAHRWAYEHFVGPISNGLVIDHLCRIRRCVNPDHLEAVTQAENMRRWKEAPMSEEERVIYEVKRRAQRAAKRARINKRLAQFFYNVEVIPDGCWLWAGTCTEDGYGLFGTPTRAHRWSYERFIGPISEGMQLDHTCCVRHCVNPYHLEPVTSRENTLRGQTITGLNALKTACPAGHPLDGENTYIDARGSRACKICRREAVRKFQRKGKEHLEPFESFEPPLAPGRKKKPLLDQPMLFTFSHRIS